MRPSWGPYPGTAAGAQSYPLASCSGCRYGMPKGAERRFQTAEDFPEGLAEVG